MERGTKQLEMSRLMEDLQKSTVVDSLSFSPNPDIVPGPQECLSTNRSGKCRVEAEQGSCRKALQEDCVVSRRIGVQ